MTTYALNSGEEVQTMEIENTRTNPPQALYTFRILNGRNRGCELRLSEREMILNGVRRVK